MRDLLFLFFGMAACLLGAPPTQGETFSLDLSKAANMGLTVTFEPGPGVEDAQAKSGFSSLPTGSSRFRGVPFTILDPSRNQGRSLVALKGRRQPSYPQAVSIPAGRSGVSFLYFLHTCWWGGTSPDITVAEYDVLYADGSVEIIPLRVGKELTAFWGADDTQTSFLAWWHKYKNLSMGVNLYPWKNPHPSKRIESIVFKSLNKMPLPILLAVTGSDSELAMSAGSPKPEQPLKTDVSQWKVFEIPANSPRGSAIDMSFLLDAPAGKHGKVGARGGNLAFEDGTPARFWGVQLPEDWWELGLEKIEKIADRLSLCGCNLIYADHPNDSARMGNVVPWIWLVDHMKAKGIYVCWKHGKDEAANTPVSNAGKDDPAVVPEELFMIGNALWDSPSGKEKSLLLFKDLPMVMNPGESLPAALLKGRPLRQPFLAVWGAGWPNEYLAETPLLMAAYSVFQGWTGSIGMEVESGDWGNQTAPGLNASDKPVLWSQWPTAALVFLRGDLKEGKLFVVSPSAEPGSSLKILAHRSGLSPDALERTDTAGELKARVQEARKTFISDSGQINWQGNVGLVKLDAPRFQAFIGFLGHQTLENPTWKVETPNLFAALSVVSLKKTPVYLCDHLLLTGATRMENTGMVFNKTKTKLLSAGQGPILVEPLRAKITLYRTQKDPSLKVRALDANGNALKARVPAKWVGNSLVLSWIPGAFYLEVYRG